MDTLFFDIETTGFKASTSHLYMIGCARRSKGSWQIIQWMAEKPSEECALLRTFTAFARPFKTMVQFNGNRFDIPYLEEKYEQYALPSPFVSFEHCHDLYVDVKPHKTLLGLSRLNQKSVEQFLQIHREDPFNGGELINVYRNYVKTGSAAAAAALWLHNREDVEGMIKLTGLYAYTDLIPCTASDAGNFIDIERSDCAITASWSHKVVFPVPHSIKSCEDTPYQLDLKDQTVTVTIPFLSDTLFHFFPNWREYYYLPAEDEAYHKSVAAFVDSAHRVKAKPEQCHVRRQGVFLPFQTARSSDPVFHRFYKDPVDWFEVSPDFLADTNALHEYIVTIVSSVL